MYLLLKGVLKRYFLKQWNSTVNIFITIHSKEINFMIIFLTSMLIYDPDLYTLKYKDARFIAWNVIVKLFNEALTKIQKCIVSQGKGEQHTQKINASAILQLQKPAKQRGRTKQEEESIRIWRHRIAR